MSTFFYFKGHAGEVIINSLSINRIYIRDVGEYIGQDNAVRFYVVVDSGDSEVASATDLMTKEDAEKEFHRIALLLGAV